MRKTSHGLSMCPEGLVVVGCFFLCFFFGNKLLRVRHDITVCEQE